MMKGCGSVQVVVHVAHTIIMLINVALRQEFHVDM